VVGAICESSKNNTNEKNLLYLPSLLRGRDEFIRVPLVNTKGQPPPPSSSGASNNHVPNIQEQSLGREIFVDHHHVPVENANTRSLILIDADGNKENENHHHDDNNTTSNIPPVQEENSSNNNNIDYKDWIIASLLVMMLSVMVRLFLYHSRYSMSQLLIHFGCISREELKDKKIQNILSKCELTLTEAHLTPRTIIDDDIEAQTDVMGDDESSEESEGVVVDVDDDQDYIYITIDTSSSDTTTTTPFANHTNRCKKSSFSTTATGNSEQQQKQVVIKIANECGICLCSYVVGDQVVGASSMKTTNHTATTTIKTRACTHVYHKSCMKQYIEKKMALDISNITDHGSSILCPYCRQEFASTKEEVSPTDAVIKKCNFILM